MTQTMAAPPVSERIRSIDILRGVVMVLMALDHVRDFWGPGPSPENMDDPGLALFLTRWITHFCAPVFVFLAGTSAFLYQRNTGCSDKHLSWFLFTRGFWLVIVELTIVDLGWGVVVAGFSVLQVIWAIGVSMMVLALLIHLPRAAIAGVGLVMVLGHNLFDGFTVESIESPALQAAWMAVHEGGWLPVGDIWGFWIAYPLVPWIGVMALGFAFGGMLQAPREQRDRNLVRLGLLLIAAWIVLRAFNIYGDSRPWSVAEGDAVQSLINFLNAEKYPPSLIYLLMTLGPALLVMPYIENWKGKASDFVTVFGRVPFFYYVLHLPLINITSQLYAWLRYDQVGWAFGPPEQYPEDYVQSLLLVYAAWAATVFLLYPVCKWYAGLKRRRKDWWLSYL